MCKRFTFTLAGGYPRTPYCVRAVLLARLIRAMRAHRTLAAVEAEMSGHRGARTTQPCAASMISAT